MGRKWKKRFYYIKTDARCSNKRLGGLLEGYFAGSLTPTESESFQQHLEECLFCSTRVENRDNIQAAMEYYNITPKEAWADPPEATKQMNLIVVDLSGREIPRENDLAVSAARAGSEPYTGQMYPQSSHIPHPASSYLMQAVESLHAPAGAAMLAASAIDAMLKAKGYKEGSLNSRIDKAAENHLISGEMALWGHEIRLDTSDPRHPDPTAPLPDELIAKKWLDFAGALAEFLFVLPARVKRGRKEALE